ncbi:MAG: hypothetical protein JKY52_18780 [Flavobacteriales bacterium]|nr:hypothetical protein [Flavobacteriales bacterium]
MTLFSCSYDWSTYTDSNNRFSLSYHNTWEKQNKGTTTLFLSPKEGEKDQFRENVNIMAQDLSSQPLTLEEYTDLTKQQITGKTTISIWHVNKSNVPQSMQTKSLDLPTVTPTQEI